jgi:hypothetical protein
MTRPAFVEIDGKLYRWRDLIARRREQLRLCRGGAARAVRADRGFPSGIAAHGRRPLPRAHAVRSLKIPPI